jgi:hypothetical protein
VSYELDVFGLRSEILVFQSDYVPLISFQNKDQKDAAEKYIFDEVKEFFEKLKIDIDINENQLAYPKLITEEDFTKVKVDYFYETLFHDLERNPQGKLEVKIKWGITFDEKCAPIKLAYLSPKYTGFHPELKFEDFQGRPHRRYGTIDINGTPVFYYIYFTLQEILDVIKGISRPFNSF